MESKIYGKACPSTTLGSALVDANMRESQIARLILPYGGPRSTPDGDEVSTGSDGDRVQLTHDRGCEQETRSLPLPVLTPLRGN